MDEKALAQSIASGDKAALRQVYETVGREMYMFALTLTKGNEADADDVLQDCFVRLWEGRRKLRTVNSLRGYLFTMLRNLFLNIRRTELREAARRRVIAEGPSQGDVDTAAVDDALGDLPEEQRLVVVLRIWGRLTLAETAEALGISANTAASRYRYALGKLRERLGDVQ
ncbi:MAG: RNA polymerase sigma factor [Planctomycetes bacterium]|nr:RNA polymerase sigma factor [Planctomycetota bacterium]